MSTRNEGKKSLPAIFPTRDHPLPANRQNLGILPRLNLVCRAGWHII
ncbi:MAG: hypothetical protein OP8BY_1053 [Candidatus Saccharicenans subterraneus]|uniref:Uncharacterized protein n=1 Tax=Candidatus Saccharicenans subterraneus TaxID=2508984 RepID=A0A3E2BQX4_9BACT|nr:MAG: hypothetical protein OP8BY_1053 [Candidatus Saccharicenans subterraneum]